MSVGGQRQAPVNLHQRKEWYPLYRGLGGPQGRSGRVRKNSNSPGFDSRTIQEVTTRYKADLFRSERKFWESL